MTLLWNNFNVQGTITTVGGDIISLQSDLKASDYSVLSINGVQLKLAEQDLKDLVTLVSREAFPRLGVK